MPGRNRRLKLLGFIERRFRAGRQGAAPDAAETLAPLARKGLFVIGHARSGTTVLQNALNDSADIFLVGEPDFHTDPGTPDFAARYAARQRGFGNQPSKSTALPPLDRDDAPWFVWLQRLARHYARVGSKIVLNPGDDPAHAALLTFQGRLFYEADYVFAFRNPLDVAVSVQKLRDWTGGEKPAPGALRDSLIASFRLYIHMVRLFPHVHAVVHEDVDEQRFAALGGALGVDLGRAATYYEAGRNRHYELAELDPASHDDIARLMFIYEEFRACVRAGPVLAQLEQNALNFSPGHHTPIGRIAVLLDMAARGEGEVKEGLLF